MHVDYIIIALIVLWFTLCKVCEKIHAMHYHKGLPRWVRFVPELDFTSFLNLILASALFVYFIIVVGSRFDCKAILANYEVLNEAIENSSTINDYEAAVLYEKAISMDEELKKARVLDKLFDLSIDDQVLDLEPLSTKLHPLSEE